MSFARAALAEDENKWVDFPFDVSGSYRADYYGRWNSEDSEDDHQLYQYLNLHVENIMSEKVSLHFSGRLTAELDGTDGSSDFFADIYDSYDNSLNGRIYYLYLDIKDPIWQHSDLRLGRQYSYEAQNILFTGVKYTQTIDKLRFYAQGGFRGTNYTSPEEDDTIGGLGVDYRILPYTSIGYDYLRVVDDELDDDYHSFDISQRFGSLTTFARLSLLNTEADELNLYGSYYYTPLDLNVTARYYTLLNERGRLTNEFSALIDLDSFDTHDSDTLGVYFPFHLVNLSAYKGFGDTFAVSGGYEARWMDEDSDKNDFNRQYDRFFASLEVWNLLVKGLDTSFTVEYWDVDAGESSFSFGIDVEKDLTDRLNAQAGFYYSEYKIRTSFVGMTFSEDIETPSFYGKLRYKLRDNVNLVARYEIEDESDLGTSHEIHLGCSIGF